LPNTTNRLHRVHSFRRSASGKCAAAPKYGKELFSLGREPCGSPAILIAAALPRLAQRCVKGARRRRVRRARP
jgi:hypothetical protein